MPSNRFRCSGGRISTSSSWFPIISGSTGSWLKLFCNFKILCRERNVRPGRPGRTWPNNSRIHSTIVACSIFRKGQSKREVKSKMTFIRFKSVHGCLRNTVFWKRFLFDFTHWKSTWRDLFSSFSQDMEINGLKIAIQTMLIILHLSYYLWDISTDVNYSVIGTLLTSVHNYKQLLVFLWVLVLLFLS